MVVLTSKMKLLMKSEENTIGAMYNTEDLSKGKVNL